MRFWLYWLFLALDIVIIRSKRMSFFEGDDGENVNPNEEFKNSPLITAVAVGGQYAELPCNISSPERGDIVNLVLWYRDNVPTPIYSYDARSGISSRPKEWSDPKILGRRAYFRPGGKVGSLVLNVTSKDDEAVYRCRVDFQKHTTMHFRVNLTVIHPIENVRIEDSAGRELVGVAGPYNIGERPALTCNVLGGIPKPTINWFRDGKILEYIFNTRASTQSSRLRSDSHGVQNRVTQESSTMPGPFSASLTQARSSLILLSTIHLRALKKEDLRTTFTCRASNHPMAPTKEASVEIDMNFGPENVEIRGLDRPVSAGKVLQVVCEARGSRPPATLTWWLDDSMLKTTSQVTSIDGKASTSTLKLTLKPSDEGRKLTCRAENGQLPAATVEHSVTIQVLFPPEVTLKAGRSLNLAAIKEGDDVYFDCHVRARPEAFRISWQFNDEELNHNVSQRVMVVGNSLVLQKISRRQAGNYSCLAANSEGSNISKPIELSVKFAPVCRVEQTDVYGVGRLEKTTVTCRVDADPPASSYRWAFNNTGELVNLSMSHYAIKTDGDLGQGSDLRYSPVSDHDYGTLLCWATNPVGIQQKPCTFTIFPAGKPDVVSSCKQYNHSESSVAVLCEPGYGGGMNQSFLIQAWDDDTLMATDRSDSPLLEVSGLRPGTRYTFRVFSINSIGRSQPHTFTAFTLTDVAERRTAIGVGEEDQDMTPVLGAIIGAVSCVVLLLIVGVVIVKHKCKMSQQEACEDTQNNDERYEPGGKYETEITKVDSPGAKGCAAPRHPDVPPICDLISTSQDSMMMSRSQDSQTLLIGNTKTVPLTSPSAFPPEHCIQNLAHPASSAFLRRQHQPMPTSPFDEKDNSSSLPYRDFRGPSTLHHSPYVPALDYQSPVLSESAWENTSRSSIKESSGAPSSRGSSPFDYLISSKPPSVSDPRRYPFVSQHSQVTASGPMFPSIADRVDVEHLHHPIVNESVNYNYNKETHNYQCASDPHSELAHASQQESSV